MKLRKQIKVLSLVPIMLMASCTRYNSSSEVLNVDQNFPFPASMPPDPGEAGKRTLEGIDSDKDGIRDDLQRWIYARYPNEPKKQAALRQQARDFQNTLIVPKSDSELRRYADLAMRTTVCMGTVFPTTNNVSNSLIEMEYLRAKAINTRKRTEQYLRDDARLDGMVFALPYQDKNVCD